MPDTRMSTMMGTVTPVLVVVGPDGIARWFVQNPVPIACAACGRHQTMFQLEMVCPNEQKEQPALGFIRPPQAAKPKKKTAPVGAGPTGGGPAMAVGTPVEIDES